MKILLLGSGGREDALALDPAVTELHAAPGNPGLAKPIYEYLDGWHEDISGCRSFDELPATCQAYVKRLEELIGCRISGIGVGPGREQSVAINDLI